MQLELAYALTVHKTQGNQFKTVILVILEGKIKRLDFKIEDYDMETVWYWEHCGMMMDLGYRKQWEEKKKFYEKNGIVEGKNFIVTYDDEKVD